MNKYKYSRKQIVYSMHHTLYNGKINFTVGDIERWLLATKPESDKESLGSRKGLRKFWRLGEYNPKLRVVGGEGGGKADGKGSTECGGFVLSESDKEKCECSRDGQGGCPGNCMCECHKPKESKYGISEPLDKGQCKFLMEWLKPSKKRKKKISEEEFMKLLDDARGTFPEMQPKEELEVEPLKKTYFYSNEPMTDREEFVARGQERHHDKIQELIKAHNALVKEVRK